MYAHIYDITVNYFTVAIFIHKISTNLKSSDFDNCHCVRSQLCQNMKESRTNKREEREREGKRDWEGVGRWGVGG